MWKKWGLGYITIFINQTKPLFEYVVSYSYLATETAQKDADHADCLG